MRLLKHLSFSNVIAVLALFVALGGAAYAGSKINGRAIVKGSIAGNKLHDETITARKIKKGTLTGAQFQPRSISAAAINLSTFGTVPSAQTAQTADSAKTATTADTANSARTAQTANTADTANSAGTAQSAATADTANRATTAQTATDANHAQTADRAGDADHATSADTADHATEADQAATATDAKTLEGATVGDLTVSCSATTELYGGVCWDKTTRPAAVWLVALKTCGDAAGRLPSIGELIAFVLRDGKQVEGQVWSNDLVELAGGKELVLTSDEEKRQQNESISGIFGYRCVFSLTN